MNKKKLAIKRLGNNKLLSTDLFLTRFQIKTYFCYPFLNSNYEKTSLSGIMPCINNAT
jgi:hypothetical protein